jgi:hypothetical protein
LLSFDCPQVRGEPAFAVGLEARGTAGIALAKRKPKDAIAVCRSAPVASPPRGHYQALIDIPEAERSIPNGGSNCDYLGCRLDHRHLCGDAAFIHRHLDRALVLMGWLANQTARSRIQMVGLKH